VNDNLIELCSWLKHVKAVRHLNITLHCCRFNSRCADVGADLDLPIPQPIRWQDPVDTIRQMSCSATGKILSLSRRVTWPSSPSGKGWALWLATFWPFQYSAIVETMNRFRGCFTHFISSLTIYCESEMCLLIFCMWFNPRQISLLSTSRSEWMLKVSRTTFTSFYLLGFHFLGGRFAKDIRCCQRFCMHHLFCCWGSTAPFDL